MVVNIWAQSSAFWFSQASVGLGRWLLLGVPAKHMDGEGREESLLDLLSCLAKTLWGPLSRGAALSPSTPPFLLCREVNRFPVKVYLNNNKKLKCIRVDDMPSTWLNTFCVLTHLISVTTLWGRYYYPFFRWENSLRKLRYFLKTIELGSCRAGVWERSESLLFLVTHSGLLSKAASGTA